MKLEIITHNEIVGFHCWKNAPEELTFLRSRHRHVFYIRCYIPIAQYDRELEIFSEEEKVAQYLRDRYGDPCEFRDMSCESIARELLIYMKANEVEVLEDNRGGAKVARHAESTFCGR